MSKKGMAQATAVVALLMVLSKIVGFLRDQLIAMFFGATGLTDAYMVSTLISGFVGAMLSGPISTAFLPVFAADLAKGDQIGARRVASSVFTISAGAVLLVSLAAIPFSSRLVTLVAPGLSGSDYEIAVRMTQVFFPAMVLPLLTALVKCVLNSFKEFTVPGVSPFIQNLVIVATVALLAPVTGITSLTVGTVLGYAGALLVQVPSLRKTGLLPGLSLELNEGTLKVLKLAIPLVAQALFGQLYQMVDKNLASKFPEGSIAALGFADRLRQLPVGLFVTAVTTVVYPALSEMWARKDRERLSETVLMGLRYAEFVCVPSMVGFLVLAEPITRLVYQRGAFTGEATALTASVLAAYAPAIIGMAASQVIVIAFYSSQKTWIPVLLGTGTAIINIGLDLVLVRFLGLVGLALANSLASVSGAILSLYVFSRCIARLPLWDLAASMLKIASASGIMGIFAFLAAEFLGFTRGFGSFGKDALTGALVIGSSVLVYLGAAALLKCQEIELVTNLVRERFARIGRKSSESEKGANLQ
ncbi:MAG: murein biosynthesis integral membrane protein MurJ [Candidatus Fermentithermobacillus carboniphilus]|uniref:Probable lipid II flippase MurJ n=1 Tax=Candidatus Fermentithermobacillus carboniphilus TaxID=3085328 RepID=A0AAT9LAH3_9FIRM|nr:MAG: murein biosynthesis integral membrane protein MurJ [Candidatus Fermentithermobacillus carboniphilus]